MEADVIEDPRTEEELRWGPCDCHEDEYWERMWSAEPYDWEHVAYINGRLN